MHQHTGGKKQTTPKNPPEKPQYLRDILPYRLACNFSFHSIRAFFKQGVGCGKLF